MVSRRKKRYIELCKRVAENSESSDYRHGAVLVKGSTVLNVANNKNVHARFGKRFRKRDCGHATHHAELGCILGLDKSKTSGATVYVVRVNKQGVYRLSKPCPMCHEILKFCGVRKVVYTAGDDELRCYKI